MYVLLKQKTKEKLLVFKLLTYEEKIILVFVEIILRIKYLKYIAIMYI